MEKAASPQDPQSRSCVALPLPQCMIGTCAAARWSLVPTNRSVPLGTNTHELVQRRCIAPGVRYVSLPQRRPVQLYVRRQCLKRTCSSLSLPLSLPRGRPDDGLPPWGWDGISTTAARCRRTKRRRKRKERQSIQGERLQTTEFQ